jgi:Flp pilus assembly protein protease CpaA
VPAETLTAASFLQAALFFALIAAAAAADVATGRVPVRFCGAAAILGLLLATLRGGAWGGPASVSLGSHALAALGAGGVFLAAWRAGGIGRGDAWLAGAVGALAGIRLTVWVLALASLAGMLLAVGLLLAHGRLRVGLAGAGRNLFRLRYVGPPAPRASETGETPPPSGSVVPWRVPYAAAFLAGGLAAVWIQIARGAPLPFG